MSRSFSLINAYPILRIPHTTHTPYYVYLILRLPHTTPTPPSGSGFSKTQEESTLQARMAFAKIMLRLELVASTLSIKTDAGEFDSPSGKFVHNFRDTARDPDGELPRDHSDENVFDKATPTDSI